MDRRAVDVQRDQGRRSRVIPRGKIDIGWSDLLHGLAACLGPANREEEERRVEALWSPRGDALVCLSVRSGFDLLLSALDYPAGSEILVSAINIRDMVRVVREHDLVPVPVDLDMETLSLKPESLERGVGPRTKALLVAHLFGDQMPLEPAAAFARKHDLLLVEDCAQSFTGRQYRGHSASDVSMFSFGPIKTATALGGALLRVRDERLRARMKEIQSGYPLQTREYFLRRIGRFALVKLALSRAAFTLLCETCRLLRKNHDDVINLAIRGFHGPRLLDNLRKQPSPALLALLARRIGRFDEGRITRRVESAKELISLAPALPRPGASAARHSFWTFPILSPEPDRLVQSLSERGFDATRGAWSLCAVPAPEGREGATADEAAATMSRIVYLPSWPAIRRAELPRLARAVEDAEAEGPAVEASPRQIPTS
jgi:perosamine synthetase